MNQNKLIEQLEKLSNKKVILLENEEELDNGIFIPRNLETRDVKWKQKVYRLLQQSVIEGDLDLSDLPFELENLENLGNVREVKGNLDLQHTLITSLPAGLKVGDYLDLQNTKITSLPEGLEVGGTLDLRNTPISKNPKLLAQYRKKYKIIT